MNLVTQPVLLGVRECNSIRQHTAAIFTTLGSIALT